MKHRGRIAQWGIAAVAVGLLFGAGVAQAAPDHYLCYSAVPTKGEIKLKAPFPIKDLKDPIEDLSYDAKKVSWHCNPATKIHNAITSTPSHSDIHLEGYGIGLTKTSPIKQVESKPRSALVRDQFGVWPILIKAPESVDVPTSKQIIATGPKFTACSATKVCVDPNTTCLVSAGVCVPTPFTCAAGDPAKLGNACTANANCDGPGLTTGNGSCLTPHICTAGDPAKVGNASCTADANCDGPGLTTGNGVCTLKNLGFLAPPADNGPVDNFKCYKAGLQPGVKFTKIVNNVLAKDEFGGMCTDGDFNLINTFCTSNGACDSFGLPLTCAAGDPAKLGHVCAANANCDGPGLTTGNGVCLDATGSNHDGVCGPIAYDITAVSRVCLPVDKDSENPGAETHTDSLMCYKIALTKFPGLKPTKFPKFKVADSNTNFDDNRLDVTAVKELCVPATDTIYYCGDGVVSQPFEDCDAPKICSGAPNAGLPCTGNSQCSPGTCVPNLACPDPSTGAPNQVACSKTCQCPMVTGTSQYHVSDFGMSITAGADIFPGGLVNFDLTSAGTNGGTTTLDLAVGLPDPVGGLRQLTMNKSSWVFDAIAIPASDSLPLDLSVRLCPDTDGTGVLFTKATAASYPALVCLSGDPLKVTTACTTDPDCDGPGLITGNGVCATRDLDYTSTTTSSATNYSQGNTKKDSAGAALMGLTLRADLYLGQFTCLGTGLPGKDCTAGDPDKLNTYCTVNADCDGPTPTTGNGVCTTAVDDYYDCLSCDNTTLAPAGRIGIISQSGQGAATPTVALSLPMRFTTATVENTVTQPLNPLDGREIKGTGYLTTGRSLRLGAASARLDIDSGGIAGILQAQFFATLALSPVP